jgi:ATP-dependent exoDNAse (exonuclease V) beta subunit
MGDRNKSGGHFSIFREPARFPEMHVRLASQFCEFVALRTYLLLSSRRAITELKMLSKEYFETARTLLRIARNMTDQTIAGRLRALAEDYERCTDAGKAVAPVAVRGEGEGSTPK